MQGKYKLLLFENSCENQTGLFGQLEGIVYGKDSFQTQSR